MGKASGLDQAIESIEYDIKVLQATLVRLQTQKVEQQRQDTKAKRSRVGKAAAKDAPCEMTSPSAIWRSWDVVDVDG